LITRGRNSWILLAKVLVRILYMLPKSVIGRQFPNFEWSPKLWNQGDHALVDVF
jgi:hypothetical protein